MLDTIVNEIIIASGILKTNNASRIAEELGYRPLVFINALYRGKDTGKFVYDKKKDIITISEDVEADKLSITEGVSELREQLEILAGYLEQEKTDMTLEELQMMLGGTPILHIKIAVLTSSILTTYELADPKDKESVYTFVTLRENAEHMWGKKQFVAGKSKAAKRVKNAK